MLLLAPERFSLLVLVLAQAPLPFQELLLALPLVQLLPPAWLLELLAWLLPWLPA